MSEYFLFVIVRKIIGRDRLLNIIEPINFFFRKVTAFGHSWQMRLEWDRPIPPEWFNHFHDQYWQWHAKRNPLWLERGIFNLLAVKKDAKVLELCCGDGFNSYHFYSIRAKNIVAVDFGKEAIAHAKKYNQTENISFRLGDIRKKLPVGIYDNVIWDAAIEHFTPAEIKGVLIKIKKSLAERGVLSGYTLINDGQSKLHALHEHEFKSKEEFREFLLPFFKNVIVFETDYPTRKNLYFFASNGYVPKVYVFS